MPPRYNLDLMAMPYAQTEQAAELVSVTLWGRERRLRQCDRGASARILARALCVPGASNEALASCEQATRVGIQSAIQSWSGLTSGERDRKVQSWQMSRQREYPNADWGAGAVAAAEMLRSLAVRDLAALAQAAAKGNPAAQGEAARLSRNLEPRSHRMNLGAALFIRNRLDQLATDRANAGQPIPRCLVCGQFMARAGDGHQCPIATTSAAAEGDEVAALSESVEYAPPPALSAVWAMLPDDVRARLSETREYPALGEMPRAGFVAGALADKDAVAMYFARDNHWVVVRGEIAYPVGRAEMLALARLDPSIIEAGGGDHGRAARLASNVATPRELWHELVGHPHPLVRCALATRRDVDADTLTALYEAALPEPDTAGLDEDEAAVMRFQQAGVRRLAVENKNAPATLLKQAAADPDQWVRGEAERRLAVSEATAPQQGSALNCPVCGRFINPQFGCLHCNQLRAADDALQAGSSGASTPATASDAALAAAKSLPDAVAGGSQPYDPNRSLELLRALQAAPPRDEAEALRRAAAVLRAYAEGPGRSWLLVEPQVVTVAGKRYVASVEHIWGGRLTRIITPDGACYRYIDNLGDGQIQRITTTTNSVAYQYQMQSAELESVVRKIGGLRKEQRGLERERLRLSEGELRYFDDDYTNLMRREELAASWFPLAEAAPDTPLLMTVREELELAALGTRPVERDLTVAEQSYLQACRERLRLGQAGWVKHYQGWRMGGEDGEQLRYQPQLAWSSAARERYDEDWLLYFADHWQPRIAEEGADSGVSSGAYAEEYQDPALAAAAAWAACEWPDKLAAVPYAARAMAEESYLERYTYSCQTAWQARREEVSRELFAQAANRADQAAADDVAAGGYEDADLSDTASDLWDKLDGDSQVKPFPPEWQQQIRAEFAAQHQSAYDDRWQANWASLMFEVEQEAEQQAMRAARSGGDAEQMASEGWQRSRFSDTIRQPQRAAEAEALFSERFSQVFDENREQGAEDIDA